MGRRPLLSSAETKWNEWPFKLSAAISLTPQTSITTMVKQKQSYSQSISQCFRVLCHASCSTLRTWSDVQRLLLILVRRFFNRGRGKSLRNESLRISQSTNKSTPTVTDTSHGLHMPESQDDSDTFFCSECYIHFTGVVGTSAWASLYVTQVCFYTNIHICEHTRCRLCTYVYMYICVYMHACAYGCICVSMI